MLDTFRKATPEALATIQEEMRIRRTREIFILFTMGSQFDHLIAIELGKLGVYCLAADPASVKAEDILKLKPKGIILSGGPASVVSEPPPFDSAILDIGIPVLGICLGFQMWAKHIGIRVSGGSEFGQHKMRVYPGKLFDDCGETMDVLQSHGECVAEDERLTILGMTGDIVAAASYKHLYGVQFHPEVPETTEGLEIFRNFCFKICGAKDRFPAGNIAEQKVEKLREDTNGKCVLLLLSGGSDSSTCAYLTKEALRGEKRLRGLYIKGIDRPDDEAFVIKHFANKPWIDLKIVDATDRFLDALAWPENLVKRIVSCLFFKWPPKSMKKKRLAMRKVYKAIAEEEAELLSKETGLPVVIEQGTLYTDISESGGGLAKDKPTKSLIPSLREKLAGLLKRLTGKTIKKVRKAVIKVHHNTNLGFRFPEITPLADVVKDGGRNIGREIGVPEELLIRHPFPGPGLLVRIEGVITRMKLAIARQIDGIFIDELRKAGLYGKIWQAGAVVTNSTHTYTKGDDAGTGPVIAIWAVSSVHGFTAEAYDLPFVFLKRLSRRIGNEVRGIGALVYRFSGKPFSTIEWG